MIEQYDKMRDDIISIKSEIDYKLCIVQYGKDVVDDLVKKHNVSINPKINFVIESLDNRDGYVVTLKNGVSYKVKNVQEAIELKDKLEKEGNNV